MPEQNLTEFNNIYLCLSLIDTIISMNKIVITNEDQSFTTFLKLLHDEKIITEANHLRCKKGQTRMTRGNKYKKVEL